MSYLEDHQKNLDAGKSAHALWEVWKKSNKEEDREIWWKALSNIKSKHYLTIQLTIWPVDEVDANKIKEMLENNDTNLPWNGGNLYNYGQVIGEIVEARASIWPKPCM